MKKIKMFIYNYWIYIVAGLIPWIVMIVHSLIADTWVTGNGSLLTGDLTAQIVPFAYELWEKVHTGDSLMYSWNVAGGCDFHGIMGVLVSPFTIVMLLFPKSWIPNFIQFEMIMKWSLMAISMVYFFYHTQHNTLEKNKKIVSLFLGLAFSLGNGMINYILYIQFMDAMILFPILLLLVEKLVNENRWKLYYLVLTFCIISNAYISFEICLFLIFWFFLQFNSRTRQKMKKFLIFSFSSILAAASSFFWVLSGVIVSQTRFSTENGSEKLEFAKTILLTVQDFVKQLFCLTDISIAREIEPNVYFSVIAVIISLFFVFINIGIKRKIYMLFGAIFLCASYFVGGLNLVWHLFSVPNGVHHRFTNLFVFIMLFLALYVFEHLQDIKLKHIVYAFVFVGSVACYTFFNIKNYGEFYVYLITFLLIALYFMILVLFCRKSISFTNMLVVVSVMGIIELCGNAYNAFSAYDAPKALTEGGVPYRCVKLLEETDMDKGERITAEMHTSNIGMIANRQADSAFISTINTDSKRFHERLGMGSNSSVEYVDRGASPLVNLLFNIRYGLGESDMVYSDVKKVDGDDYINLYRIDRLAGLGYMVNENVLDWNLQNQNCFQTQNDFVKKATNETQDIFDPVNPDAVCVDVFGKELERDADFVESGAYVYNLENKYKDDNNAIQMQFDVEEDMDLYIYTWSSAYYYISILIDGELKHSDLRSFAQETLHVGEVKKGQNITILAVPNRDLQGESTSIMFIFGKYNESVYARAYEQLSKNVYQIESMKSNYLKGKIKVDEKGIMMTSIQAMDGFRVYVDGEEIQYKVVGNAMIGIPLEKGEHTVEFEYRTPHLVLGRVVSGSAFIIFLLICLVDWMRGKGNRSSEE